MKPADATPLAIVPITALRANQYVTRWHRHHAPIPPGFPWWGVAAVADGRIVGVAIAGRPTNRNNDDGQTVEVLRVATAGHPNACSALYGACARAAKAIGAARVITYTLDDETGGSLRGAGWKAEADGIKSWWLDDRHRTPAVARPHMAMTKTRWAVTFHPPVHIELDPVEVKDVQTELFQPVDRDSYVEGFRDALSREEPA